MWVELDLPPQDWDRMLGFSIPEGNELILVTYDGIASMSLGTPRMASIDDRYPEGEGIYNIASSELRYEGQTYQTVGVQGGTPILQNQWGERIVLGVEQEMETPDGRRVKSTGEVSTLLIQDEEGNPSFEFTFRNFSRDWQRATFSREGTYIVLGMPYAIHAFRRASGSAQ
jgi:hypothetical protein